MEYTGGTMSSAIIGSAASYRVQGEVLSVDDAAKARPGIVSKIPEPEFAAMREAAAEDQRQASLPRAPEKIYAQVLLRGQVFATVYESGSAEMQREISGLSNEGAGAALAATRLQQIAQAVHGEIRRSDFLPTFGEQSSSAVKLGASFPAARVEDLLQSMTWASMRSRF